MSEDERLHNEVFFLAYHLHWGHAEIMALPTDERWIYIRRLTEQLEHENTALRDARRGSRN